MIPKIIHFCWFGKNKKSKLIEQCIDSWKKNLIDYRIIEWNENNFDIKSNEYVLSAYNERKWAFVSDYVRLHAIYHYGGIYLDSDVEVFKSFDYFLNEKAFTGFENFKGSLSPITAVMGAEINNKWIKELLDQYDTEKFTSSNGALNLITNTQRISENLIKNYHVKLNDREQILDHGNIHIYPSTYFCNYTINSYSMHHFNGSWVPLKYKIRAKLMAIARKLINS